MKGREEGQLLKQVAQEKCSYRKGLRRVSGGRGCRVGPPGWVHPDPFPLSNICQVTHCKYFHTLHPCSPYPASWAKTSVSYINECYFSSSNLNIPVASGLEKYVGFFK